MSKKRVYELAKELGLENKELITRLEKIGIAVKSHSSTLDDADLERIQAELLSPEPREVVEQRIKSTVIRRRAVRLPVEEPKPEEAAPPPPEEKPAAPPVSRPEPVLKEAVKPPAPKEVPVRTSIYRDVPAGEAIPKPTPAMKPAPKPGAAKAPVPRPAVKGDAAKPEPSAADQGAEAGTKPAPEIVSKTPAAEKKPLPVRPPESREITPPSAAGTGIRSQKPSEALRPAPPVSKKEVPRRPDLKIVKDITVPPPSRLDKTGRPVEAEKPKKKGGKPPVEVLMGEVVAPRKKALIKKLVDRKDKRIEIERGEERIPKWREEKRVAAVKMKKTPITTPKAIKRRIKVAEAITVGELAKRMGVKASEAINKLIAMGLMVTINQAIDFDTATLIASDFGYQVESAQNEADETLPKMEASPDKLKPRAPVVTIMGHVDHGKTSLLDTIRQTHVIDGEAGGITQAIGAYHVQIKGRDIVFLDTPGHEAFTAMRARGAKVTDIVVLVVAADDGVMPQTVEAINHAKAAGVPIIVAINKIDKPQADPTRVRTELLSHDVVVESMGGDTQEVLVSALKRTNLDKLLEAIHLQAEMLDLKANPDRTAEGIVIEAKLERGRGPVGTALIQRGTLHVGDIVVAGIAWGRVRALINDKGQNITAAGPSVPVEILGFDSAPEAGDQIAVVENEARAREITDYRIRKRRETLGAAGSKSTLEQMMQQLKEAGKKEFNLLVKGDVQGSVEAIAGALKKLGTDEVEARIVHSGVGGITESDVALAAASKAFIVGFNVRANAQAKQAADASGIEIRYYNIIYDLLDDVKAAMSGLLAPTIREVFLGNAEVLQVFNISKVGKVAGCRVTEGKVLRGGKVRLIRDNVVIHEGTLSVLKRFKDDVKEVPAGQECGMSFTNYQDLREGDIIECFNVETVTRTL